MIDENTANPITNTNPQEHAKTDFLQTILRENMSNKNYDVTRKGFSEITGGDVVMKSK